jgi:hypothetical protein
LLDWFRDEIFVLKNLGDRATLRAIASKSPREAIHVLHIPSREKQKRRAREIVRGALMCGCAAYLFQFAARATCLLTAASSPWYPGVDRSRRQRAPRMHRCRQIRLLIKNE